MTADGKQLIVNMGNDKEAAARHDLVSSPGALPVDFGNIRVDPSKILINKAQKLLQGFIAEQTAAKTKLEKERSVHERTRSDILKSWPAQKLTSDTALANVIKALESNLPIKLDIDRGLALYDEAENTFSCTIKIKARDESWEGTQSYEEQAPSEYTALAAPIAALTEQISEIENRTNKARIALSNSGQLEVAASAAIATQALNKSAEGKAIIATMEQEVDLNGLLASVMGDSLPSSRYTSNYRS